MKRTLIAAHLRIWSALGMAMCLSAICHAQPKPEDMPKPTPAHDLLKQFAGEWNTKAEATMVPGAEPMRCEGTESAKMVGGFWLVSHTQAEMMGTPVMSILTIGYDPATKKYVGTFICSMDSTHWKYTGAMETDGKKLVLETEGPSPTDPTKKAKYREVLELVDADHKVFTSSILGDDGKYTKFATVDYRRKK